jgi:hypothetical protein
MNGTCNTLGGENAFIALRGSKIAHEKRYG